MDKTLIPILYATLQHDGERIECPACHGGDSHEKSFTISRKPEGYLYNCYRSSCPMSGFYPTGCMPFRAAKPEAPKLKVYEHETRVMYASEAAWLMQRYSLDPGDLVDAGIMYSPKPDPRYVFPIRGPFGEHRAIVSRSFDPHKKQSKTIVYKETDAPLIHWARNSNDNALVIVEDFLSALRVRRIGATGVALLGTHLTTEATAELMKMYPMEVVIALDDDATAKAFDMAWDVRLLFPKVRVARLPKDLKDMRNDREVREVLSL